MERYDWIQQGSLPDPSPEWPVPVTGTGLEEGVWRLELGDGESGYPERPDEADCIYYLRTGVCGYGARCRFNHPRDRNAVLGAAIASGCEFPERTGQPICQYYMRTGTCKFGPSCKYHHPKQGGGGCNTPVTLNYYGYPIRVGEKECTYYVRTGHCKFGATCKFHHPQLTSFQIPFQPLASQVTPSSLAPASTPSLYPTVQTASIASSQPYGLVVARTPLLPGSYVQGSYGPVLLSPSLVPYPSWNPYLAPVSPAATPSTQPAAVAGSSVYGIAQLSASAPPYAGSYLSLPSSSGQNEQKYPERPGQPECQYYMKTGDCKFGPSCRYHHPPELTLPQENLVLSPMGLPIRPGAPLCTHFTQRGLCKFGPACKFDHSMGILCYSPSASPLTDISVSPYPAGSSFVPLPPSSSSSSSEFRPEPISGPSKSSSFSRMPKSIATSSGSDLPKVPPATQKSSPSTGSSCITHAHSAS